VSEPLFRSLPRVHVGMTIPDTRLGRVGEIAEDGLRADAPHLPAVLVIEEHCALDHVLVVGVDTGTEVAVGIEPLAGLNIDPGSDEIELGASIEDLEEMSMNAYGVEVEYLTSKDASEFIRNLQQAAA